MNYLQHLSHRALTVIFCLSFGFTAAANTSSDVAQVPLLLGSNVPGNLVLTPSVEFPTVISAANLGPYLPSQSYPGYFDENKCYLYEGQTSSSPNRTISSTRHTDDFYFYPTKPANNHECGGNNEWSGNYLNWAATQTIDPFRKALTGGYRHIDTPTKTVLGKATRAGRNDQYFGKRNLADNVARAATPYSSGVTSELYGDRVIKIKNNYYAVRVQVCVAGLLEDNCVQYSQSHKPEGLLQRYANDIRYSVFSYLNIDGNDVDGGVLRAQQDYIGQYRREPGRTGQLPNSRVEWDTTTGVLKNNPHNDSIGNSGVINYINKFGEISNQHKSNDPVSELYYAALRYLRGLSNISSYSNPANTNEKKDHFPVITKWQDPIQYRCQKNAILGIGDVNTHEDRNLLPSGDNNFMDLNAYTNKVFQLEGISKSADNVFTTNGNSAYIAGLAYWANTQDMRPDLNRNKSGDIITTAQTYWVDVRENQVLASKANNQYWLAAKYGGFKYDKYNFGEKIPDGAWKTNGQTLSTGDARPDNFFVASDAEQLVQSLEQAFAKIVADSQSTLSLAAANSSRLESDTAMFQAIVDPATWSGDLRAIKFDESFQPESTHAWSAAEKLDATTHHNTRRIFSIKPANSSQQQLITQGIEFKWSELSTVQKAALKELDDDSQTPELRLNYLRGDRSQERTGKFRNRKHLLGDIVNSDPQFLYRQDYGYRKLNWNNGAQGKKYREFRSSEAYQSRLPLVIVGANDGMLHAFNASLEGTQGGQEVFAFVPNNVIPKLKSLSSHDYNHLYTVDGSPRIADAWLSTSQRWATLAIGNSGAGGNSIYALDVTDITSNSSFNASRVLWEFSHPKMGNSFGSPTLVALANETFGVIVTSGYRGSSAEEGYVWILNAETGAILKEFTLPNAGGLGAPLVSDISNNKVGDRIHIGDTLGNVWRLDINNANTNAWGIPAHLNNGPLFVATDTSGQRQPITAPLTSTRNPQNKLLLMFGTGSFMMNGDNEISSNPQLQSLYGLIDDQQPINRTALLEQQVILQQQTNGKLLRAISQNTLASNHQGWYMDLHWSKAQGGNGAQGERIVTRADIKKGRVTFTSMTPNPDPCSPGGSSMIMTMNAFTGGRLDTAYLDFPPVTIDGKVVFFTGMAHDSVVKGVFSLISNDPEKNSILCFVDSNGELICQDRESDEDDPPQIRSWRIINE